MSLKNVTTIPAAAREIDATTHEEIAHDPDTAFECRGEDVERSTAVPPRKRLFTLRVDADVLHGFKRDGAGYQQRINQVLRQHAVEQGWIAPDLANASRGRGRPRKAK